MDKKKLFCIFAVIVLIAPVGALWAQVPTPVVAGRDEGTRVPDTFTLTVLGTGTNKTYTLRDMERLPLTWINSTDPGGTGGAWVGVKIRDLVAAHDDGLWEYDIKYDTWDGFSPTRGMNEVTNGETILAWFVNGTFLDSTTTGWWKVIADGVGSGAAWPGNVTEIELVNINTTMTANVWNLEVDAYTDQMLSYDDLIHLPRETHFGWRGSGMAEPGYYSGVMLSEIVEEYTGPWVNYTVTMVASDGFNRTLSKAAVDSRDIIVTYAMNGSQFSYANNGWLVRAFSLNDTSPQSGQYSIKNLSRILIDPLENFDQFRLRILNSDSGVMLADYDELELTAMPYLEGPADTYNDWGTSASHKRGYVYYRGVNFSWLLEQSGVTPNPWQTLEANTTAEHGWGVIDIAASGPTDRFSMNESLNGYDHNATGIIWFARDGLYFSNPGFGLVNDDGAPRHQGARWTSVDTIKLSNFGAEAPDDVTTTDNTTDPGPGVLPPIDPVVLMMMAALGGFVVVIVLVVWYVKKEPIP
ncbi:MAG: hypothetical protein ACW976_05540 [Candidatus Ranarchaeia archaeon]